MEEIPARGPGRHRVSAQTLEGHIHSLLELSSPLLRRDLLERHAIRQLTAVTAVLADILVDDDELLRGRHFSALLSPAALVAQLSS